MLLSQHVDDFLRAVRKDLLPMCYGAGLLYFTVLSVVKFVFAKCRGGKVICQAGITWVFVVFFLSLQSSARFVFKKLIFVAVLAGSDQSQQHCINGKCPQST